MEMNRREFLAGAGAMATIIAGGCASMSNARPLPKFAYVGCYSTKRRNGRGEGVTVHRIDAVTGAWTQIQLVKTADNPSWLTFDRHERFLYAAHGDGDVVTAFRVDEATGQLSLLPIQPDGSLGPVTDVAALPGKPGPHRTQQPSSQPHDIVFDPRGRFIVVPDKGLDATFVFSLDTASGKLVPAAVPSVASRSGAGPRHAGFHPAKPYAYLLNELDSTLTTYRF